MGRPFLKDILDPLLNSLTLELNGNMIIYPDFLPPRYTYLAFHAERSNSEVVDANLVEILCDRVCRC